MSAGVHEGMSDRLAHLLHECDRLQALLAGLKALLEKPNDSYEGLMCDIAHSTVQAIRNEIDSIEGDMRRSAPGAQS